MFSYAGIFFDERYHYTASVAHSVFSILYENHFEDFSLKNVISCYITQKLSRILEFGNYVTNVVVTVQQTELFNSILCMDLCKTGDVLPFPISMKELRN